MGESEGRLKECEKSSGELGGREGSEVRAWLLFVPLDEEDDGLGGICNWGGRVEWVRGGGWYDLLLFMVVYEDITPRLALSNSSRTSPLTPNRTSYDTERGSERTSSR